MRKPRLLAIDQGTTSTRAILFDDQARPVKSHAIPLRQIYPANGWVEHDPREIWQAALDCCKTVLKGEEASIDWLESQLHVVQDIGKERYLAEQLG